MKYTKTDALLCLKDCKTLLDEYTIPSWDELPTIDLYMDQVIELVNRYLGLLLLFSGENGEITRPMINNYVKLKMMPAPVKKKYSRVHLAYIIVICTLKQSLNISTIQKILPIEISEEDVKTIYNSFAKNQRAAFDYIAKQADSVAAPILSAEDAALNQIDDLIIQVASSANILKCLTEKIVSYQEKESK
ncbi:MAG: DUF1836 domain-containing protein [Clostridia bacterium]|nr:DUF1836 domain-containing protein [Clostridia bacterium]